MDLLFPLIEHPTSLASFLADNRSPFRSQILQMCNPKAQDSRGSLLYVQAQRLFWLEEIIEEMVRQGVRQIWLALAFKMILLVCRILARAQQLGVLQVGLILLVRGSSFLLSSPFFEIFKNRFLSWSGGSTTKGGTNVGAIVGGILGGVAFILACAILLWIFRRRRNGHKKSRLPTDILDAEDDDDAPEQAELPRPVPFILPVPPESTSEYDDDSRPFSPGTRSSFYTTRSDTPDLASTLGLGVAGVANGDSIGTSRKGGAPRPMRAVNIVQHQDAGPSNTGEREEPVETIELPPAYTMVRTAGGGPSTPPGN